MRALRAVAATIVFLLAALAMPSVVPARTASQGGGRPASPAAGDTAASRLATCVQTRGRLSVVVLMDESGSLAATDPDAQRVEGLRATLAGLSRLADTPSGSDRRRPRVDVLLAGFSGKVVPDPSAAGAQWRSLNPSTLDGVLQTAGRLYTDADTGQDTDYALALTGARRFLQGRAADLARADGAAETAARPCQAVIFFTDGEFDIRDRNGRKARAQGLPTQLSYAPGVDVTGDGRDVTVEAAVRAGKDYLCRTGGRTGGLMDAYATDGTFGTLLFTVALSSRLSQADRSFLEGMTDGTGTPCGDRRSPKVGQYLGADGSQDLFFKFGDLLAGADTAPTEGDGEFRAAQGMDRFILRAVTGADGVAVRLTGPRGHRLDLRLGGPTTQRLDGATITQRWVSRRAVEIEGRFDRRSEDWIGGWTYGFTPVGAGDTRPRSTLQLFADVSPVLLGRKEIVRGAPTTLRLALQRRDGTRVTGGPLITGGTMTAEVTDPESSETSPVSVTPEPGGLFVARTSLPGSSAAARLFLKATIEFSGRDLQVAQQTGSFQLAVRDPPGQGFPVVTPDELHLPSIAGADTAGAMVTITGSSSGGGCVTFGTARVSGPGRPTVATDAGTGCVRVGRGQRRTVRVTITTKDDDATGSVDATLPITLQSDLKRGETRSVLLRLDGEVYSKPKVALRWAIVSVLTLLGIAIPLLLLHVLNVLSARFAPPQRVRAQVVDDVVVRPADVSTDRGPLRRDWEAFGLLSDTGQSRAVRELSVGPVALHAVASGSREDRRLTLFSGPYGVATSDGRPIVGGLAGAGEVVPLRGGVAHEVPLGLAGSWLFVPEDIRWPEEAAAAYGDDGDGPAQPDEVRGTLVLFVADGGGLTAAADVVTAAEGALGTHTWTAVSGVLDAQRAEADRPSPLARLKARFRRSDDGGPQDVPWTDDESAAGGSGDGFADDGPDDEWGGSSGGSASSGSGSDDDWSGTSGSVDTGSDDDLAGRDDEEPSGPGGSSSNW
ncbi:VWA domain-containing protein [Patulibacter minatonensis]|uniref:VWA domain-containing protein n=1 Tax=Patulibacter minatonensis TaxID=298163 RepID=UPI000479AA6D|nr:VWA domain-containing protein [Patulibacter minatonensis]